MIIGISHISFNTNNLDSAINQWQEKGYELVFAERAISNSPAKRSFLKEYQDRHSIAFLRKNNSNNIELIEHHRQILGKNDLYEFAENRITINFSQYKKSSRFWVDGLGFLQETGLLLKAAPVAQMMARFNIRKSGNKTCLLDYDGVSCIALHSTDLDNDIKALADFGAKVSDKINLTVNGRKLEIFMAEGPSGEMIELVKFS